MNVFKDFGCLNMNAIKICMHQQAVDQVYEWNKPTFPQMKLKLWGYLFVLNVMTFWYLIYSKSNEGFSWQINHLDLFIIYFSSTTMNYLPEKLFAGFSLCTQHQQWSEILTESIWWNNPLLKMSPVHGWNYKINRLNDPCLNHISVLSSLRTGDCYPHLQYLYPFHFPVGRHFNVLTLHHPRINTNLLR